MIKTNRLTSFILLAILLCVCFDIHAVNRNIVHFRKGNLQRIIDQTKPYGTIQCDRSVELCVETAIVIDKPLTITNLCARIKEGVGKTPLLKVTAENVTLTNLKLTGNVNTISVDDRQPLIYVTAGNFIIRDSEFHNSSKDGIMVSATGLSKDIVNGRIENIKGFGCWADVVSISGDDGNGGKRIRNVVIDQVSCFGSIARGGVEISDGTDNIKATNIYAQDAIYAVDIQDHQFGNQVNENVTVSNVFAKNCKWGIVTRNNDFGHSRLTLSNITISDCKEPMNISNTKFLVIDNVLVRGSGKGKNHIYIKNCQDVNLKNFRWANSTNTGSNLLLKGCSQVLTDFDYNLAYNPFDTRVQSGVFPHASSNSETRDDPAFFALNAIDGKLNNQGHGKDFPSWGPEKRTDLWWKVDFGKKVKVNKLIILLRADLPHDSFWNSATIEFSDGSMEQIKFEKTVKPQVFSFSQKSTEWVKIHSLNQPEPLGWCSFSEVEVWGNEIVN